MTMKSRSQIIAEHTCRCVQAGGKDYIEGYEGYHMAGCFVPASIIECLPYTLEYWREAHDHSLCVYIKDLWTKQIKR